MAPGTVFLPILVSLVVPMTAQAQQGVHLEVLGGPLFEPSQVRCDVHVGWTAGLGISYDLGPEVQAVHTVSFCRFPDGGWTEEDGYIFWEPVGAASGGGQTRDLFFQDGYEVSAAVRFGAPGAHVDSYLSLGVGVQSAKLRREGSFLWSGETRGHRGDWVTKGFTSAGVGVTVPVRRSWRLMLESRLTMATDGTAVFVPVVAGAQLRL